MHRDRTDYTNHKRAQQVYSQWMAGYAEEEIARFFGIELQEVLRDIQHIHQVLPTRTVIAHLNDRNRILIQRAEQEQYRRLLADALATPVDNYLQAGVSPVGPMKEFREATGMVSKAEPLLQINAQQNIIGGTPENGSGIRSAEDAIRRVLALMTEAETRAAASGTGSSSPAAEPGVELEAVTDVEDYDANPPQ